MMVPFVDKLVTHGYGVFDTLYVVDGFIYNLESHIRRFQDSLQKAGLKCPVPIPKLRKIVWQMAQTGKHLWETNIRFFCGRGPSDLEICTKSESTCSLYILALEGGLRKTPKHIEVATTTVPVKPDFLAEMKTTNYVINCRAFEEAFAQNGAHPIFVNENDEVTESSIAGLGFILNDGTFYSPEYKGLLRSTTIDRIIAYCQNELIPKGELKQVKRELMKVTELKEESVEMIMIGGDKIIGITKWDDKYFGSGMGPFAEKFLAYVRNRDMRESEVAIKIKYE